MYGQTGTAPSLIIKDKNAVSVLVCVRAHMEMISSSDMKGM